MRTAASRCGLAVFLSHFDAFLLHMTVAATTAAVTGRIAAAVRDAALRSVVGGFISPSVPLLAPPPDPGTSAAFSWQMVQAVLSSAWEASAVSSIVKEVVARGCAWKGVASGVAA